MYKIGTKVRIENGDVMGIVTREVNEYNEVAIETPYSTLIMNVNDLEVVDLEVVERGYFRYKFFSRNLFGIVSWYVSERVNPGLWDQIAEYFTHE